MTEGTNPRLLSRMAILAFVALTFAGCAALLAGGEASLLSDIAI